MTQRDEHYWVGALSMTIAVAAVSPDPRPVLKPVLRDFLKDRPPGNELGDMLRAELGGKL